MLFGLCINRVIPQDKWVIEPDTYWRHSLGCALVTQRMAKKIEYPEPEKAYLAGLLHDLGLLVNSILYTEEFRKCLRQAAKQHLPLHIVEEQILGFTHCDTGGILCEHWGFSKDLVDAARCHHDVTLLPTAGPLACLVHLSDLLCRVSYLGYGYDEIMGVDLDRDVAWQALVDKYPALKNMDLVRFTLDIDGAMDQIVATVDSVFGVKSVAAPAAT
jgi:HD superfamily phosphohydrolase YqeK